MHLLRSFRFSTYLTLALACLCLGYAEGTLLPESPFITAAVILLIGVAYRFEGRWSLSLRAANIVGGALALLLIGWVVVQFLRPTTELVQNLPFPAFLLPFLGPVLMILIPAKLFRPKHVGDFWTMQAIGLLAVSLGCAMAHDMFFGVLLVLYGFSFAWSMGLFCLYREAREAALAEPNGKRASRSFLVRPALRWSALISAGGVIVFLATPRPQDSKWELPMVMRGKERLETGLSQDVDLNRTGTLKPDEVLAFSVEAKDAQGEPKLDLDLEQRWRAAAMVAYDGGKWTRGRDPDRIMTTPPPRIPIKGKEPPRSDAVRLPEFGPRSYTLSFYLSQPTHSMAIAASPVLWRPNDKPPIHVFGPRLSPLLQRSDTSFEWISAPAAHRPSYVQITALTDQPDLGPPMMLRSGYVEYLTVIKNAQLRNRVHIHTSHLLARLVSENKLPSAAIHELDPITGLPAARHHEAIARALERYLATSGEFRYTLQLERSDRQLDPVEDFLFKTKAGHCERFASALVIMLRSQGIAAQLVTGYRGCESHGNGRYDVRQSHAHAWVEALIYRSPPAQLLPPLPDDASPKLTEAQHWLSLDPTPGGGPELLEDKSLGVWLQETLARGETIFREFILGYNAASHQRAFESISDFFEEAMDDLTAFRLTRPVAILSTIVLLPIGGFVVRRSWRRRRTANEADVAREELDRIAPYHGRLLDLLTANGLTPRTGQTPREFTDDVSSQLSVNGGAAVANVPPRIAEAYYRARFGGVAPDADELTALDRELDQLADYLRTHSISPASNSGNETS